MGSETGSLPGKPVDLAGLATTCFTEIVEVAQRKMMYFRFWRLLKCVRILGLYILAIIVVFYSLVPAILRICPSQSEYWFKLRSTLNV